MSFVTRPVAIGLLIATGCAHAPPPPPPAPVAQPDPHPDWIEHLPTDDGFLYAVGVSGPTFFPDDGIRYASEKGRAQLAFTISSHVTAASLSVETTSGSLADSASVVDATHDYTDSIVRFSEVLSIWVDKSGNYSGAPGTTYALVRIRKSSAVPASVAPAPSP